MTDSFDSDPLGNLDARVNQIEQLATAQAHQAQAAHQQQALVSAYQQQAAEYTQQNGQFQDAYKELVDNRQKELTAVGYSEQQAANLLVQEEAMIVQKALQDGVNPAERMFELAKAKGFQASPNSVAELEQEAAQFNAMAAADAATVDPDSMSDADLDRIWSELERDAKNEPYPY